MAAPAEGGRLESLGIPVRVGGLMGCIVSPNGRGGEVLYFDFNQDGAPLFLAQVDPNTGEAVYFGSGPTLWRYRLPSQEPFAQPDKKAP